MEELNTDVCIVGAGAAGLWAAAACGRRGVPALVLEKTRRSGTKVLSSGGSRCNLTTTLDARQAAPHFGAASEFIRPALRALTPQHVRARFEALGVPTKVELEFEKVFPASDSAVDVRNALLRDAQAHGARLLLESPVVAIEPRDGGWVAHSTARRVSCRRLLVCTGGKSYPKSGTTGDGYGWLAALGLEIVEPVPALVPLASPAPWVQALSGISVDGELRVGKLRRRRPVLFTHRGLSGPGAMDVSEPVARGLAHEARLDLLPDTSWEELVALLVAAAGQPGSPALASLLPLPRRVVEVVAVQAGLGEENPRVNRIDRAGRHRLVDALKGLRIPLSGTLGFDKAEVTAGGLALHEVDRRTMQVRRAPGLYVFGELLDLSGPIGGFNFQAAFATAELAAQSACRRDAPAE